MAGLTKNIVPRNSGEGGLGTTFKHWLYGFFDNLFAGSITDGTKTIGVSEVRDFIDSKDKTNGLASLDNSGKLLSDQIPLVLLGALHYQGLWNSSTNNPTIPSATMDNKGYFYRVSTPSNGVTTIDTNSTWTLGDWVISNGKSWDRLQDVNNILAVNGKVGDVNLSSTDIGLGNVTNDAQVKKTVNSVDGAVSLWDGATGDKLKIGPKIGVASGNLVALDENAKLPVLDGSNLTNLTIPVQEVNPLDLVPFL